MLKECQLNLIFGCCLVQLVVCQRWNHSNFQSSRKIQPARTVGNSFNALQFNLDHQRFPATRIFYSTMPNGLNAFPLARPTFPSNSLVSRTSDRRRKASLKNTKNRKYCFTCLTEFKLNKFRHSTFNDNCLNPLKNLTETEARFLSVCPLSSQYCQIETITVNGVLTIVERRCSNICTPLCFQKSYGTEYETCTYCCPMFENEDAIDEASLSRCPK